MRWRDWMVLMVKSTRFRKVRWRLRVRHSAKMAVRCSCPERRYLPIRPGTGTRTDLTLQADRNAVAVAHQLHVDGGVEGFADVVAAAQHDGVLRSVIDFGQRRTHPMAAIDAAYAAYIAGCSATSNLAATYCLGFLQEPWITLRCKLVNGCRLGCGNRDAFFAVSVNYFPAMPRCWLIPMIRSAALKMRCALPTENWPECDFDSGVTPESVRRARKLLSDLGAPHAKLFCQMVWMNTAFAISQQQPAAMVSDWVKTSPVVQTQRRE